MRERPILFNGDMVRAILDGRKTVTRRLVPSWQLPTETSQADGDKLRWMSVAQRDPRWGFGVFGASEAECMAQYNEDGPRCCPFGNEGDRLWVRENWWQAGEWQPRYPMVDECVWHGSSRVFYSADGLPPNEPNRHLPGGAPKGYTAADPNVVWRHRPSIHMPRWASRILLEVTAVRVERLQDITEEQAIAEGIDLDALADSQERYDMVLAGSCAAGRATPITAFRDLWLSTGGDWDANPWVWVIQFKRAEASHA